MASTNQPTLFDVPSAPAFAGPEYTPALDRERLTTQYGAILDFMLAQTGWLTLSEIVAALRKLHPSIGFPENSVQAQLRNIRKEPRYLVEKRRRGNLTSGLYEFHVSQPKGQL